MFDRVVSSKLEIQHRRTMARRGDRGREMKWTRFFVGAGSRFTEMVRSSNGSEQPFYDVPATALPYSW